MIEVEHLSKRFGKTLAVDDLTFRVESGTITGFLGPNGAGKTTTLRALLGLVHPTSGLATIDGKPYRRLAAPTRRVGAVLEATSFHPGRTGRNHLRVLASVAGIPVRRVDEVLDLVDLRAAAKKRVRSYSLGMRQRLSIAGALLGDPEVLVLDEPANGLDPEGIRWLRRLLLGLAGEGRTILISSHVLAEVAQTADRAVIIHKGRLVSEASLAELTSSKAAGAQVRTPQPDELRKLLAAQGIEAKEVDGGRLATAASAQQVGELAAEHGIVLHELFDRVGTLEEVFLELTGEPEAEG